jgi:hypothetical protein
MTTEFTPEPARLATGEFVTDLTAQLAHDGAHVRQGDVLLVRRSAKPLGAGRLPRENGAVVLAHGEVTGHKHQLRGPQVNYYRDSGHEYISIAGGSEPLVHEEHSALLMPPGDFELGQQVEFSPAELRNVAD